MIYLLSYPHSGNTWVRYCLEFITQQPTHGHRIFCISQRKKNFLNVNLNATPVAIKRHEIIDNEITLEDNLILILRHPTKCIKFNVENVELELKKYYSLIEFYENFKGNKLILNFNDLFTDLKWLNNLIDKCNIKYINNNLNDLLERFEYHKQQSKSIYQNTVNLRGLNSSSIPDYILNNKYVYRTL